MTRKLNLGVLVSGNGSNLQAIIDRCEDGTLDAQINVVLCNNRDAYALVRCLDQNISARFIDHRIFSTRESFDRNVLETLNAAGVELVIMAGFMRILSEEFFRAFPMRIMNIHPSLLPAFPGIHVQQKAIDYGVRFSGCTVHFVDEGVDTGPIIIQSVVPVYDDDTKDTLSHRILMEEHRIYPQAIQYYAEGRIEVLGRKVRIKNLSRPPETVLHNPPLTRF
jgi:phosphoribosylglycinamide formyltransferase-1